MFTKYIKYRFSIAQLIQPVYNPYWTTYGTEMPVFKSEVLDNLLQTSITILTQDNSDILKQYKKDLKQTKEIKHNIEFSNDIEWGILERLFQLRAELDNKKFQFVLQKNESSKPQWKQIGELEVYGLSPYRHQNHYIHEFNHRIENEKVTFEVKQQVQQQSNIEKNSEKLAKPILDTLDKEKQDVAGFFGRAKNFVKKVNKLVINEDILKEEETKTSWKKYILEPSKNERIMVRDYEYEFEGILTIKDQNNQYLYNTEFVNEIQPQLHKIYLRTEAWMDAKESLSTKKGKRQVLTDFNCLLRGNPWVWVKKFDEEEN